MQRDDDGVPKFRVSVVDALFHHKRQFVFGKPDLGRNFSEISIGEPPSGNAFIIVEFGREL
jgi:hypothetical protein